jgi:hypothetical protein
MSGRGARSIPTTYGGIAFRSKLEARVASLLTHLGLKWEYEPQGYELPSGKYLPDFRVVTGRKGEHFWIEVKGPVPNAREFAVATDINLHVGPLMILQGDIPRKPLGGTAWIFALDMVGEEIHGDWFMTTPERALAGALARTGYETEAPPLEGFEEACTAAWHDTYARTGDH